MNGSVTITPKEPSLNVPSLYNSGQNGGNFYERPWFSILPLGNPIDHSPKLETDAHKPTPIFDGPKPFPDHMSLSLGPIQHQISALEDKLESVRKMNTDHKRMPVPKGDIMLIINTAHPLVSQALSEINRTWASLNCQFVYAVCISATL